jgi:hypothetical protein
MSARVSMVVKLVCAKAGTQDKIHGRTRRHPSREGSQPIECRNACLDHTRVPLGLLGRISSGRERIANLLGRHL